MKLFRRRDGQSLTLNLVDRRQGEKAPLDLTIDLGKHDFANPGGATLYTLDGHQTLLATRIDRGKLILTVPPISEVAAIIVRRAAESR